MDALQFIASLVKSLASPAAVIIAALLLREPLVSLLPRLRLLKFKDFHVEFGEKLEKVEAEASKLLPVVATAHDKKHDDRAEPVAGLPPNLAVLLAWQGVEEALKAVADKAGFRLRRGVAPSVLALAMADLDLIKPSTLKLIRELRTLRNLAVHPDEDRTITAEEAARYREIANRVVAALREDAV